MKFPEIASSVPEEAAVEELPWSGLVKAHLRWRRRRASITSASQAGYRSVLERLAAHLADRGVGLDVDSDTLLEAVESFFDRDGWSPTTRATMLGIIRPFLEWAAAQGHVAGGVASRLRNPRRGRPLPRALKAAQVVSLLNHVPDARGAVIVLLEAQAGLRRAEVATIRWPGDVDLTDGAVLVRGKGRVERMVYLSPETAEAIRFWLGQRGTAPGALVCGHDGPAHFLTPTWVGILVGRWMTDAGLKTMPGDGVSGHSLRHTAATALLRSSHNLAVVQQALGHANIATTSRYLLADSDEVRQAMAAVSYGRRLRAVSGDGG